MDNTIKKEKYLFSLSVGPVQTFISQSRKVQDLYAGSKLLSDLTEKAIKKISFITNNSSDLVFPNKELKSKPNRFLCIIETEKDITSIGKEVENELRLFFESIFNEIIAKEYKNNISSDDNIKIKNQIKSFLNIYWLAIPFANNYSESFEKLEKLFSSIKRVKTFEQVNETGKKCSLCGEREAVFNRNNFKSSFRFTKNEGLCSICLTKRFYDSSKISFESTADIALMETLNIFKETEEFKNYNSCFEHIDGQLYYEENLNKTYYNKNNITKIKSENEVLDSYLKLVRKIKESNKKLSKYYALINLDVDNAGDFMSGVDIKNKSEILEYQKELSKSLATFSEKAKKYVLGEDNNLNQKGEPIYAGGDDFLCFLNINHLLPTLKYLKELFDIEVNGKISDFIDRKISFSVGIVISHYKLPLSEVLKQARISVKKAKSLKNDNKNAFCISLLKHSGEIHETYYNHKIKKSDSTDEIYTSDILLDIINYSKNKILSNTWEKNIANEFSKLINELPKALSNNDKKSMYRSEIARLIKRSVIEKEKISKEDLENFIERIYSLLLDSKTLENFIAALNISEFISREVNI